MKRAPCTQTEVVACSGSEAERSARRKVFENASTKTIRRLPRLAIFSGCGGGGMDGYRVTGRGERTGSLN